VLWFVLLAGVVGFLVLRRDRQWSVEWALLGATAVMALTALVLLAIGRGSDPVSDPSPEAVEQYRRFKQENRKR